MDDSLKCDSTRHAVGRDLFEPWLRNIRLRAGAQENSGRKKFIRECQSNSTAEANFATMEKKGIALWIVATSID